MHRVSAASLTTFAWYIAGISYFSWGCHICKVLPKVCKTYQTIRLGEGPEEGEDEDEGNVPIIDLPSRLTGGSIVREPRKADTA